MEQNYHYKKHFITAMLVIAVYAVVMQLLPILIIKPAQTLLASTTINPGGFSIVICALLALVICLWLTRDKEYWASVFTKPREPFSTVVLWGVIGFVLVLIGQGLAALIEVKFLGIPTGSQNTADIVEAAKVAPSLLLVVTVVGPILEEFVFRRSIFGVLLKPTNYLIAALISSLMFAVIHLEFTHLLVYAVSGFVFSFVYYKTRSIWTPIIAHVLLNSFVSIVNLNVDKIDMIQQQWIIWFY